MKKVLEIIGCKVAKGLFGIEIEAEGRNMQMIDNDVWNTVDDGSLRGNFPDGRAEYVLRRPIDYKHVEAALDNLKEAQAEAKFDFSMRTSVHVHMNIQQLTEDQLGNLIYTYLLIEELMVEYCGANRRANRFCLRLQDADGLIGALQSFYTEGLRNSLRHFNDNVRYASINLAAIPKYGSVEFRAMRGTLDKDVLMTWVSALNNMREFAIKQANVAAIYELYGNTSYEEFLEMVLGDQAEKFKIDDWQTAMARCFSLSIDIPHLYKMGAAHRFRIKEALKEVEIPPAQFRRGQINFNEDPFPEPQL